MTPTEPVVSLTAPTATVAPPTPATVPAIAAAVDDAPTTIEPPPILEDDDFTETNHAQLRNAIAPAPAAARRPAPPSEIRIPGDRRRDALSPTAFARPGGPSASAVTPVTAPISPSGPLLMPAAVPPPTPLPPPPPVVSSRPPWATDPGETDTTRRRPSGAPPFHAPVPAEPPPTRIQRDDANADRPFTPPRVLAVPEIPEPGLIQAARYTIEFTRAAWQRRGAIRLLGAEIKEDTEALDQVLGALGRAARGARVEGRVFSAENTAINGAEERIAQLQRESAEVEGRKAEENSKFVDVERERNDKLGEAERVVEEAGRELANLEGQRRALRDKRKDLERRQKALVRSAEDHERQASSSQMGDQRQELRHAAEGYRREAAALEPERQDVERRLAALERPISEAAARLDAGKAELDAAKRSLNDAREGHTHRLAELDAEQKRKAREAALAEAEIQRRLVTLGTLVNLNRIEDARFDELYQRIDRLRGAITARTTEIEKLTAEREARDPGTWWRGVATILGAFVGLIALIVILRAIL
jgi:hypothetical protein